MTANGIYMRVLLGIKEIGNVVEAYFVYITCLAH